MLPAEQAKFFEMITAALSAWLKFPTDADLKAWWNECRGLTLEGLQVALKSHKDDPDRGERAPRPADITRRLKTGSRDGHQCAAVGASGRCEYPGIFSEGTMGDGPWYCPWHRVEHSGPEAARWIDISHNVPWQEAQAKRTERMLAEAQRAPGAVATAHAIALRHGNRPWEIKQRIEMPAHLRNEDADEVAA